MSEAEQGSEWGDFLPFEEEELDGVGTNFDPRALFTPSLSGSQGGLSLSSGLWLEDTPHDSAFRSPSPALSSPATSPPPPSPSGQVQVKQEQQHPPQQQQQPPQLQQQQPPQQMPQSNNGYTTEPPPPKFRRTMDGKSPGFETNYSVEQQQQQHPHQHPQYQQYPYQPQPGQPQYPKQEPPPSHPYPPASYPPPHQQPPPTASTTPFAPSFPSFDPNYMETQAKIQGDLEEISQVLGEMEGEIKKDMEEQRGFVKRFVSSVKQEEGGVGTKGKGKEELEGAFEEYRRNLRERKEEVQRIFDKNILAPSSLNFGRLLALRIQRLLFQLELCEKELERVVAVGRGMGVGGVGVEGLVGLVLRDPPVSQVMFKRKVIEESFHMSLVASPSVTVDEIGKVVITFVQGTASCQVEELSCGGMFGGGSRGVGAGEGEVKEFLVRNIKIEVASGVSLVPLLFSLPASLRMGVGSESTGRRRGGVRMSVFASDPYYIVAITNQSQWIDAENKLLIRELYRGEDHTTVEWCFFVNCLHSRFLQATKQKDSDPSRPFSLSDLKYFHQKFFNSSQVVTSKQISYFWKWFGPIMQTLKFKKHINSLWFSGLLLGVVSKADCKNVLQNQREGTFIVRFSEGNPGLFAIAFVYDEPPSSPTAGERVKHYLVRPEDIGSQKSLPDFLKEKIQLKFILRYDYRRNQLHSTDKESALKAYYSKSKAAWYRLQFLLERIKT